MQNPVYRVFAVGIISILAGSQVFAQPDRPAPLQPGGRSGPALPRGPLITVNFPGGTMRDYVALVQKAAAPSQVNVVQPPNAAEMKLPEISLKEVTVKSALEAIQWALYDEYGNPQFGIQASSNDGDTTPLYAVVVLRNVQQQMGRPQGVPRSQEQRSQIEVFSIRELIEGRGGGEGDEAKQGRANVLSAIEAALRMQRDEGQPPPEIKLHQETSLLIVRGTQDQINIVRSVLNRLRDDAERRGASSRSQVNRDRERTARARKLTAQIDLAKKELEYTRKHMSRLQGLAKSGPPQASGDEAAMAELEAARAESKVVQLEQELRDLMKEGPPESSGGQGGDQKAVVYDLTGLTEVIAEVLTLAKAIVEPVGGSAVVANQTLKVEAPEEQQVLVRTLFHIMRKGDLPTTVKAKP